MTSIRKPGSPTFSHASPSILSKGSTTCCHGIGAPPSGTLIKPPEPKMTRARSSPDAYEDALARHGRPDIFNTDQGSQFTGSAFTGMLTKHDIAISMDGKGAWRDNVFVERLWRSVKYEEVYLRAYETVGEARASIGRYLDFYNGRRPHSSLDGRTPDQAYFNSLPLRLAA